MHVRKGKEDLTIQLTDDFPQRGDTLSVSILEPIPREPASRVLMVEQVDQPIWRALPPITAPARWAGSLEELADALSQRFGQESGCVCGGSVTLEDQVVGQSDAMALPDRPDFMVTIGVESDERETIAGTPDQHLFIMVFKHHSAAAES